MLGEWTAMGNPCVGENADRTFGGQSTHVITVDPENDKYIAMFDKWNKLDLINSRYIWLPVQFKEGVPYVEWMDNWTLDFFQ